ncbi:MAG: tRNA preQ1(34) S-adenosylmethionine ribosyltransferase-isomerase QueA [Terriglobales bacterium]
MLVSEFDYHLPEELIAQAPLADRAASRMLHLVREGGKVEDRHFRELPNLLRADDLVVFNDTRVFPARLYGRRSGSRAHAVSSHNRAAKEFLRGRVEVLLTGPARSTVDGRPSMDDSPLVWNALVRPGRKIGVEEKLFFGDHDELRAQVVGRGEFGERTLRFEPVEDFFSVIEKIGHVPLPPYIARPDERGDRERYQTIYARNRGSVAAPTAGLHFTPEILEQMKARGIETAEITLHVGLGTFQPVHVDRVEEHKLHREWYGISEKAASAINAALKQGRRVVAVGTTTVRTLEYAASRRQESGSGIQRIEAGCGEADIFIYPGFKFRVVGAMLTNFHLPKSTLLMLVSAFAGREFVLETYRHAVEGKYRFYSYGDCMLVE